MSGGRITRPRLLSKPLEQVFCFGRHGNIIGAQKPKQLKSMPLNSPVLHHVLYTI